MSDHAAQPPADHSGRAVGGGRYQLRTLLGTGGMASVHLAYDTALDRQVAVKTMHGELGRESSFRERFKREAQSVAKLTHPHIVSVFDTGEDTLEGLPVPYIVMEYVDGRPLRSELDADVAQFGAMPADKALRITMDVCAALDISHEMGLVHRDIKPGNVMITKRGVVKVMDFGIARAMQSGVTAMTQTGMVVGTPQYLSPEQALGRGVDTRADLYSVGVLLFELLTGRLPFNADSPLAIAYAHVQETPPAPSSVNASVPPAVDALVARALRKNPEERFQSAQELRAECERVIGTLTGAAPRITGAPPAASGAAVANSVFPPYGAAPATPPGANAHPSAPHPSAPPPSTPPPSTPPPSPYGQPGGGYAYPGPAAGAPTAPPQQAVSTPPPYNLTPSPARPPAKKRSSGLVIGAILAALLLAAGGVALVLLARADDGDGGGEEQYTDDAAAVQSTEPAQTTTEEEREPRYKEGDVNATMQASECGYARDYYDQDEYPGAVTMPDFYGMHVSSVKDCIRAGRYTDADGNEYAWDYTNEEVDEVVKGEGIVVGQWPAANDPFTPAEDEIVLTVSTGYEDL